MKNITLKKVLGVILALLLFPTMIAIVQYFSHDGTFIDSILMGFLIDGFIVIFGSVVALILLLIGIWED
jgi:hypothetical protein